MPRKKAVPEEQPEKIKQDIEPEVNERKQFFELDFNNLDKDLNPEEQQEWNSIYASYRGRSVMSGTIIGIDRYKLKSENDEFKEMLCAVVIPYRNRIMIPETEMWVQGKERPSYVMGNMIGAEIDFVITRVFREDGFAVASRRSASNSRRYYFSRRQNLFVPGSRHKCRVLSVGPKSVLLECFGHDVTLGQKDMDYNAIPDLRIKYRPGMVLDCVIKSYDTETHNLHISVKETKPNPFIGAQKRHPIGSRRKAVISAKYGGGVFCELPDGTVCMCNYMYRFEDSDFAIGDNIMLLVHRFDDEKQQMYGKIVSKW